MITRYLDLIELSFYFPQEEFTLVDGNLLFHGIDLMKLIEEHGSPLKITYLPKISQNIRTKNSGDLTPFTDDENYALNVEKTEKKESLLLLCLEFSEVYKTRFGR